ncbi:MAG TPA: hypothetical protein PLP82_13855 [Deltaproteobacteria bacterium]|nr:hypothetical protein [Deltaproteobacteria bacterium]
MILGIPKEVLEQEGRVAAIPETVGQYVEMGFRVLVEASAGEEALARDEHYVSAGAGIVPDAVSLFRAADLVATMVADVEPARLTTEELHMFFSLLFAAGADTTRNAAAGGLLALIDRPDQMRAARAARDRNGSVSPTLLEIYAEDGKHLLQQQLLRVDDIVGLPPKHGDHLRIGHRIGQDDPVHEHRGFVCDPYGTALHEHQLSGSLMGHLEARQELGVRTFQVHRRPGALLRSFRILPADLYEIYPEYPGIATDGLGSLPFVIRQEVDHEHIAP